ncbi:GGDEF domain-containing protein [Sulfuricystis multivorans]|uniref:GGDEF domain-containing protein n=1 Tax=Sulfuricystis multivorans TaxID=2211108 RepID=UPI000F84A0B0|nr:GGDEF domain-containing protein [Sulfuricystis multivorans]
MEYHDTIEQSAEYLRMALPLMTKQAAALHPISYAIWYEYVAGINPPLRQRIDELIHDGRVLDEAMVQQLYRDHIAEIDEAIARRVSQGFDKVMQDIDASTTQAAAQTKEFGATLERWSADVAAGKSDAISLSAIGEVLHRSQDLRQIVAALQADLAVSRSEIEQLRKEVSRAREEAMIDGLTGLANRRGFDAKLAACLAETPGEAVGPSLLMADIDHFKRINDNFGHLFGDKVIRNIATILRDNVKGQDLAARYGGEEFVVLLRDTPLAGALTLAEKIRRIVENSRIKRIGSDEVVSNLTISIGVACREPGESAETLIGRADAALYQSKQSGRNRVSAA